jgi:hypothetical protein
MLHHHIDDIICSSILKHIKKRMKLTRFLSDLCESGFRKSCKTNQAICFNLWPNGLSSRSCPQSLSRTNGPELPRTWSYSFSRRECARPRSVPLPPDRRRLWPSGKRVSHRLSADALLLSNCQSSRGPWGRSCCWPPLPEPQLRLSQPISLRLSVDRRRFWVPFALGQEESKGFFGVIIRLLSYDQS